jgi:hypothetical protein
VKTLLAAAFLLLSFSAYGQSRAEKDQLAKEKFLNLQFFADGRGMHLVPEMIEVYEKMSKIPGPRGWMERKLRNEWGFNVIDHKIVGLFNVPYKEMSVGVLGCVACHSGQAAGVFVPGLGNKTIDVVAIGKDARSFQDLYLKLKLKPKKGEDYKQVTESALKFADRLSNEKIGNLTQGHVTVSFIRQWFYDQAGEKIPDDITRGAVKIPSLWGYEQKRRSGQFSDGFGNGELPGWAIAVELTAGQEVETVRNYLPQVVEAENIFADFLPPKYPFEINDEMASRGLKVFEKNCQGCHGQYHYDETGMPVYEAPKWISLSVVKTDSDRLKSNSPHFRELVKNNPLNDVIQATDLGDGFFAQRLVGIWARFPYLHNASVPNIRALLTKASDRPQVFSLEKAGDRESFDEKNLGLRSAKDEKQKKKWLKKALNGKRNIFWTARVGHSSEGHEYGVLLDDSDKADLIEYLKTL